MSWIRARAAGSCGDPGGECPALFLGGVSRGDPGVDPSCTPTLAPGEEFSVCVTVTVRIPLVPEFVDVNTATGQFVVERDRYVDG